MLRRRTAAAAAPSARRSGARGAARGRTHPPYRAIRRSLLAVTAAAALLAPAALAHSGSPDFLSTVESVTPAVDGMQVEVLNRDDRLVVRAPTGTEVEIEGYSEEPYARIAADGTVEVNRNSPAYFLNQDRYQAVPAPEGLVDEPPDWEVVSETGQFEWHDHRMHWMGKGRPPQVTDPDARTKVFDWSVPVAIDGTDGEIAGTLLWTPQAGDGLPAWAIAGLVVLVIGSAVGGVVLQRRRLTRADSGEEREAW